LLWISSNNIAHIQIDRFGQPDDLFIPCRTLLRPDRVTEDQFVGVFALVPAAGTDDDRSPQQNRQQSGDRGCQRRGIEKRNQQTAHRPLVRHQSDRLPLAQSLLEADQGIAFWYEYFSARPPRAI
jgi:hypothetical protein